MATATIAVVDGYLGPGHYHTWQDLESQTRTEVKRYETAVRRLGSQAQELTGRIYWDLRLLEKVAGDYREGLERIAAGKRVSKDQLDAVYEIYSLAVGVVELENDLLEIVWVSGFLTALVAFPFVVFEEQAKRLKKAIEVLQGLLKEARGVVKEAWAQGVLDTALLGITVLMPQLGIVAKLSMAVGSWVADEMLGTEKSPHVAKADNAGDVAAPALDIVESVDKFSDRTRRIAGKAGKVIEVAGLFFDADEINEAYKHAGEIESKMKQAERAYDDLRATIRKNRTQLTKLRVTFARAKKAADDARENAGNIRGERDKSVLKSGYPTKAPILWRS
jgi:hypothetical protein